MTNGRSKVWRVNVSRQSNIADGDGGRDLLGGKEGNGRTKWSTETSRTRVERRVAMEQCEHLARNERSSHAACCAMTLATAAMVRDDD